MLSSVWTLLYFHFSRRLCQRSSSSPVQRGDTCPSCPSTAQKHLNNPFFSLLGCDQLCPCQCTWTLIINLILCVVLGRKFPGGLLSFQQRLTGCNRGTKHCKLPLNPLFLKGHTWKLRSATIQFHASHSSSSQVSEGRRPTRPPCLTSQWHTNANVYMYVCVPHLFPFYIVSQCNLFCTQD